MAEETVLIVDDRRENIVHLANNILKPNGYHVITAMDGQRGLKSILNNRPDLVILDLNMPKKDGREALKEIKADPGLRRIPVVVLTTSKEEEDVFRTYDLGANSFVSKPVTFEALVEIMKTIGQYWLQIVELPPDSEGS